MKAKYYTQRDIQKAYKQGVSEGVRQMMTIFVYHLIDYQAGTEDDAVQYMQDIENIFDSVIDGSISLEDVRKYLKEEYGLTIKD